MGNLRGSASAFAALAGCVAAIACGTLVPAVDDSEGGEPEAAADSAQDDGGARPDSGAPDSPLDACATPLAAGDPRYVFVTSDTYCPGNDFHSVAEGDAICAKVAAGAGGKLAGRCFLAWLSDGTTSPATRFVQATAGYRRTDEKVLANGWAALTAATHALSFDVNEKGVSIASSLSDVWTGTEPSGVSSSTNQHCNGWTASSSVNGGTGTSNDKSNGWSAGTSMDCSNDAHLYCFEK